MKVKSGPGYFLGAFSTFIYFYNLYSMYYFFFRFLIFFDKTRQCFMSQHLFLNFLRFCNSSGIIIPLSEPNPSVHSSISYSCLSCSSLVGRQLQFTQSAWSRILRENQSKHWENIQTLSCCEAIVSTKELLCHALCDPKDDSVLQFRFKHTFTITVVFLVHSYH